MAPRKSTASLVSNGAGDDTNIDHTPAKQTKDGVGIDVSPLIVPQSSLTKYQDLSLPKSMIARLAKGVLPANTQIHKDALLALHKSATVFVSYIASNANELAQAGGKKTIAPQDVMASIKDAELESFIPRLEQELKKYNETQCDKRNSYRHRVKQEKAAAATTTEPNGNAMDEDRPQKKQKGPEGDAILLSDDGPYDGPDDGPDDDELIDAQLNAEEAADDSEEDIEDDVVDDVEEDEEVEEPLERGPVRDEALDEPDSD
ncbi:hypothetical protein AMS68_007457 [Peltaster fructicola]|uniref:DNA polymerase epsilon subunit D n=1 Tax=Peltaster fructicola TaxID=286661 RepID=A0A6H0Y5S1_9PEZI|nr:hypothetical protein AMS68_007457 [Peltaster fructicola]